MKTPKLVYEEGEFRLYTEFCVLRVHIFHEGSHCVWISIEPDKTVIKAEYHDMDMKPAFEACMAYQTLFNMAAADFCYYAPDKLKGMFNPNRQSPRPHWGNWIDPVSCRWNDEPWDDEWAEHRATLELSMGDIQPLPDGWHFDRDTLFTSDVMYALGKIHFTGMNGNPWKFDTITINRVISILLTGLAWWYDRLCILAADWKILDALDGECPLFFETLYTDEPAIYAGLPRLEVWRNDIRLKVELPEMRWELYESCQTDKDFLKDGLSVYEQGNFVKKLAPRLMSRICKNLRNCMLDNKRMTEKLTGLHIDNIEM